LADIPDSAPGGSLGLFHSGRNYGYHSLIKGTDGKMRTVIVAGSPVGDFQNPFCNVSRFTAALESDAGHPESRHLAWSHYMGFNSNSIQCSPSKGCQPCDAANSYCHFDAVTKKYLPNVYREGDFANGCVQVYGNGIDKMDGDEILHFNTFVSSQKGMCLTEQLMVYVTNWQSTSAVNNWSTCLKNKTLASTGSWNWRVLDIPSGQGITGSENTYVWATSDKIFPQAAPFYIVEKLPAGVKYDFLQTALPASEPLRMQNIVNRNWQQSYALPTLSAGRLRPVLLKTVPESRSIAADDQPYVSLNLQDIDGDGLMEFQVTDGDPSVRTKTEHLHWVGFSHSQNKLIVKAGS
jgi:hypothetical protein